jgi:hypothetical protein
MKHKRKEVGVRGKAVGVKGERGKIGPEKASSNGPIQGPEYRNSSHVLSLG